MAGRTSSPRHSRQMNEDQSHTSTQMNLAWLCATTTGNCPESTQRTQGSLLFLVEQRFAGGLSRLPARAVWILASTPPIAMCGRGGCDVRVLQVQQKSQIVAPLLHPKSLKINVCSTVAGGGSQFGSKKACNETLFHRKQRTHSGWRAAKEHRTQGGKASFSIS